MSTGRLCLRIGTSIGSCEHGDEHSGSIKGGKFLDYLSDYQLLTEDSTELVS